MTNQRHEWGGKFFLHCKRCGANRDNLIKRHIRFIASPLGYVPDDKELNKTFPYLTEDQALVKDILV